MHKQVAALKCQLRDLEATLHKKSLVLNPAVLEDSSSDEEASSQ